MEGPLLSTKLHAPARRAGSVSRRRLTDRLTAPRRLVLIAAPAGFGKSTVLAEWLTTLGDDVRVAWVSLDERDDDSSVFWSYVLTAVDRAAPGLASGALELLATGAPPIDTVLTTLLNEVHSSAVPLVLVLDDYHVVDAAAVHDGVAFLVENLPPNARVVIASRADPALPLARLRARDELTELRAADLRFSPAEAEEYLNGSMGLDVAADDVARLGDRTEGWITALQLAALSMQSREDTADFVAGFAGDDRYVVDYLVEEVLKRQTPAMRDFLLTTSVLSRLSADLCDAVTGGDDGATTLEALDRANLFLVPLDDQREWYRYHHLFADMLRARLLHERPELARELHLRASTWFERVGATDEAIGHALDAAAFDRAARMIKAAMPDMQRRRQEVTLAAWLDLLPEAAIVSDPELAIGYAGVLLSSGRTDGVDRLLRSAESALGATSDGILGVRRGVALYRAARALSTGDIDTARDQSRVAVELAEDGSDIDRGSAYGLRGLVLWAIGELEQALATWRLSLEHLEKAGHIADTLGGSLAMGDILVALGRLGEAEALYRRSLAVARSTEPPLRGTADIHVALADVLRERGDLAGASRELAAAEALGEYAGLPQNRHRRRIARARLLHAEGDPAAGIPLLDEAEVLYTPDFFPEVRPINALRARLQLAAGRTTEASRWQRGSANEGTYLGEYDDITNVRKMTASGHDPAAIIHLIDRLLTAAENGGRRSATIELLVLRAIVAQRDEAVDSLQRAVALAEPEGYVRIFADEGALLGGVLTALIRRTGGSAYLRRLQSALSGAQGEPAGPLSEREFEVLRLLASELSGPEIARHLVVSLNTVRTHTKSIYGKLGATSRREAVRRAIDLGLLRPPG